MINERPECFYPSSLKGFRLLKVKQREKSMNTPLAIESIIIRKFNFSSIDFMKSNQFSYV